MRALNRGASMVELMVAVTLAMVTTLVVMQVLAVYEARKRTATEGNDAEIGAAIALHLLERDVRMAGAGLTMPSGMLCRLGINIYYDGAAISDAAPLAPLRLVDGGAAPDRIRVARNSADYGPAPAIIVKSMPTPSSILTVNDDAGLLENDLFIVGSPDGSKICTLMQMSREPQPTGNGWNLNHNSGQFPYNPPNPSNVFTTAIRYDVGDIVVNVGQPPMLRTFGVLCNDGGAPTDTNSCDLAAWDTLDQPASPDLVDVESISPQVVNMQAQYGIAPANSQTVDQWVDATGAWQAPTAANQARIKSMRVAIVTRGNLAREVVSPASIVLWDAGEPTERSMALSDDERHYRYKVLHVVIPLVNVIWAGV